MNSRSSVYFSMLLLFWVGTLLRGAEISLDEEIDTDLRLRVEDPKQVRNTTSVNWIDLGPSSEVSLRRPKNERVRIMIDAGHGGKDLGAQGYFEISEKRLALEIGKKVKQSLTHLSKGLGIPIEVKLSRDKDIFLSLRDRVRMANEWHADLFLSIHANSSTFRSPKGFEIYFLSQEASDAETKELAKTENAGAELIEVKSEIQSILQELKAAQHVVESGLFAEKIFETMKKRIATKRGVRQGPFTVLSGTQMPAVLVEVGYVSNPVEALDLSSPAYLKRLGNAISEGILEYARELNPRT